MADLAAHPVAVNAVGSRLVQGLRPARCMAFVTACTGVHPVAVGGAMSRAVHFVAAVTGVACHPLGTVMDVSRDALVASPVFVTDARAVTGNAVAVIGRGGHESVPRCQSPSCRIGPADMALPAAAVAGHAVVLQGALQFYRRRIGQFGIASPGHLSFEGLQRNMKVLTVQGRDFSVTGSAGLRRIGIGGGPDDISVGFFLRRCLQVSTVTLRAGDCSVHILLHEIRADQELILRLNLSRFSASPFGLGVE